MNDWAIGAVIIVPLGMLGWALYLTWADRRIQKRLKARLAQQRNLR